jgi:cysteine desulfurase
MIYLDHNATAPIAPEVIEAMRACYNRRLANPASQHAAGRQSRRVLEDARERIGATLGLDMTGRKPDQLIFTSGGTEANNLALRGMLEPIGGAKPALIVSAIEHPSVMVVAEQLERLGHRVIRLPVDCNGAVRVERLKSALSDDIKLVSVMLGNNETGVLQPVRDITSICNARGVPVHTDASQVVGKVPVNFRGLGVSLMAIAAHKFHGPPGIGALAVRGGVPISPQLFGGFQQAGLRPGTETVALAVGMLKALELWQSEADERAARMLRLRDRFEARLHAGYPDLVINGVNAERLPHTCNVGFVGLDRQALFIALDMAGIACSTGSACASGSSEPSPVLLAMRCSNDVVASSLRFSLGAGTTEAEIDDAAERILSVCRHLSTKKSAIAVRS